MKSVLVALTAGAFAIVASAQAPAPAPTAPAKPVAKERQVDVKSSTEAAANVKASTQATKMTTAEKNKFIKDVQDANKQMVNQEDRRWPPSTPWWIDPPGRFSDNLWSEKRRTAANTTPETPTRDPQR